MMRFAALPLGWSFRWKLVPATLTVALGDWIFFQRQSCGAGYGLFAMALLAGLLAGRPAVRRSRRAWIAVGAAAVFALALVYAPNLLAWTLFWIAAGMATLLPATVRFDDGWRWAQRLFWQGLRAPFSPWIDIAHLTRVRTAGRREHATLGAVFSLVALPLAGSMVILVLFSAANPLFERAISGLLPQVPGFELIPRTLLWVAFLTMAWSLLRPRLALNLLPEFMAAGDRALPGVSIVSVTTSLIIFNLIFAAQNLLDVAYLWSVVPMPQGVTMAQYAHRGAYPLIVTALLAALFVLVTLRAGSDIAGSTMIRRLVTLWIGQNILLVASSMLRTIDYIAAYSLTPLRIAALAWMALVAFGLAAICGRALRGWSAAWLINVNLSAVALVLTIASFVDLRAIAAHWNVRHAREVGGHGAALDLCYLDGLGDSALLALMTLEERRDLRPVFRDRVQAVRTRIYDRLVDEQSGGWTLRGQWRLKQARSVMQDRPQAALPYKPRDCGGTIILPAAKVELVAPARPLPMPTPSTTPHPALTGARGK